MCVCKRLWCVIGLLSLVMLMGCTTPGPKFEQPEDFQQKVSFNEVWGASNGSLGSVRTNLSPNFIDGKDALVIPDDDGDLLVIDAKTGDKVWKTDTKQKFTSAAGEAAGLILMGTQDGHVVAVDKQSGEQRWVTQVSSEVLAAPRGNEHGIVALSIDSRLHGLDPKTGKERWTFDATAPALTLRGAASPLILDDMAFVGFSNGQVAIFRLSDGQMVWLETVAKPRGRNEIERMVDIDGTMVHQGNMVYVVTYHGNLAAIDLQTLQVVWSHPMSSYVGLTMAGHQLIVSDAEDHVYSVDRTTGEVRWKQDELEERFITTPAVYEDYVAVADASGYVYALSLQNGHLLGYNRVFKSDIPSPVLVDSDGVIVQSRSGRVKKLAIVANQEE